MQAPLHSWVQQGQHVHVLVQHVCCRPNHVPRALSVCLYVSPWLYVASSTAVRACPSSSPSDSAAAMLRRPAALIQENGWLAAWCKDSRGGTVSEGHS